eukprot:1160758-Pelagomonas_calceolata.AAC.13
MWDAEGLGVQIVDGNYALNLARQTQAEKVLPTSIKGKEALRLRGAVSPLHHKAAKAENALGDLEGYCKHPAPEPGFEKYHASLFSCASLKHEVFDLSQLGRRGKGFRALSAYKGSLAEAESLRTNSQSEQATFTLSPSKKERKEKTTLAKSGACIKGRPPDTQTKRKRWHRSLRQQVGLQHGTYDTTVRQALSSELSPSFMNSPLSDDDNDQGTQLSNPSFRSVRMVCLPSISSPAFKPFQMPSNLNAYQPTGFFVRAHGRLSYGLGFVEMRLHAVCLHAWISAGPCPMNLRLFVL